MIRQLRVTQNGLRYKEAKLPDPYYNDPINTVVDSAGRLYCLVSYAVEPDYITQVGFVVTSPFHEGEEEYLNVVTVIPMPPAFDTLYGHNPMYGRWHVFQYIDNNDNFYATLTDDDSSVETFFRWDWGISQWVYHGWMQISERGYKDSATSFLKPNKPLGWVVLNENKVAHVLAGGNVITSSNRMIAAIGPYIYTYNPYEWAIEIFSPDQNATTLGSSIAKYELDYQIDPYYLSWDGGNVTCSLAPNDFSILIWLFDTYTYIEIKLDEINTYKLPYRQGDGSFIVYLGESADSPPPRFWANLVGCNEKI